MTASFLTISEMNRSEELISGWSYRYEITSMGSIEIKVSTDLTENIGTHLIRVEFLNNIEYGYYSEEVSYAYKYFTLEISDSRTCSQSWTSPTPTSTDATISSDTIEYDLQSLS